MPDDLNLVSKLTEEERLLEESTLGNISPDDAKYRKKSKDLSQYLSAKAEWLACAKVQQVLLETRMEFGQAEQKHVDEVNNAMNKLSALNMSYIEDQITKHDQLAVIEEIGRHVSPETKALLHPGTTSYDILDTARSYLFKKAWKEVIRPTISKTIEKFIDLAERSHDVLQTGRTHLKNTSPVPFGTTFALYAARIAERVEQCDKYFDNLKGKISGIVGTGASVEMVIGKGKSLEFEEKTLEKLGLEPDYTATQVVQKERLVDVGNGITTLMWTLADFANDIRLLYSSAIAEVFSADNKERLGGSSADALKDNPINYENIAGKAVVVESGMRVLYEMINTDLQRDLRSSVMARYQPQGMMTQTYESFSRTNKALGKLTLNLEKIEENLLSVRNNPSEAMVAILRGEKWVHSKYGVGHNFVKEVGKKAIKKGAYLMEIAIEDKEFRDLYDSLPREKQEILNGKLENYTGSAALRARKNIEYAKSVIS